MYPETAYAIARINEIKQELSQPMWHRYEAHRELSETRRTRWNTAVRRFGRQIVIQRRRVSRVAAVAEA